VWLFCLEAADSCDGFSPLHRASWQGSLPGRPSIILHQAGYKNTCELLAHPAGSLSSEAIGSAVGGREHIIKRPPRGQGALVSFIGRIRANTARFTDERVRLAGEAIAGSLAVKMLGEPSRHVSAVAPPVMALWCTSAEPTLAGRAHHVMALSGGVACCAPCSYHCASAHVLPPVTRYSCVAFLFGCCRRAPVHACCCRVFSVTLSLKSRRVISCTQRACQRVRVAY
jgi:hypothetical protein